MCGFAGTLLRHGVDTGAASRVSRATRSLSHRGPDSEGIFSDEGYVVLGHRRLSVVDLSEQGKQPMSSRDGRWTVVFNGEIYNAHELSSKFGFGNLPLRGSSDTEVLVESISRFGVDAVVPQLDGMFALAAWNHPERRLWLARDRFGEKPLYVWRDSRQVAFGSELRAILQLISDQPRVSVPALFDLVRYGYITGTKSIFEQVERVGPGEIRSFGLDPASDAVDRYWEPRTAAMGARSNGVTSSVGEVKASLKSSIERRLVSDVPLGAFLSGGVDSSLVVALMQQVSPSPVRTFTIGFEQPELDESGFASEVARCLGTNHSSWVVSNAEALEVVPRLGSVYDEPFADSSQIPTYLVSSLARRDVTVVLSGDGGDELFCGYDRYRAARQIELLLRNGLGPGAEFFGRVLSKVSAQRINSLASGRSGRLLPAGLRNRLGERLHRIADVLHGEKRYFYDRLMSINVDPQRFLRTDGLDLERVYEVSGVEALSLVGALMAADTETYLPDDILTKVDRASMAHGLEVRVPFLSHQVFDAAWRLPLEPNLRAGHGKQVLRQILNDYLPDHLVDRPKMGFAVPLASWLRGPLRNWADDLLSEESLRKREIWMEAEVVKSWTLHRSGAVDNASSLWPVLMFQAWASEWLR